MKLKTLITATVLSVAAITSAHADPSQIIGILGGVATAGQTVQGVQNGTMTPMGAAQVAAGGVNAYSNNQRAGQIALGAVSAARVLTGGAGGAVDPTYDAIARLGGQINPNGAQIATAVLSTAGAVGIYNPNRAAQEATYPTPVYYHPALNPVYAPPVRR